MRLARVDALTITFNPPLADGRLARQIRSTRSVARFHLIVDNGSGNVEDVEETLRSAGRTPGDSRLIRLPYNSGVAHALNVGMDALRATRDAEWILTLDQDSVVLPGAFERLGAEIDPVSEDERIAVIAFNYLEHRFNRVRPYNRSPRPALMESIITSGNFVRTRVLDQVRADDSLFLYFVDVDFCRQLRAHGHEILVSAGAFIDHQEGLRKGSDAAPMFYLQPSRLFYVGRNALTLVRRHGGVKPLVMLFYLVGMNWIAGANPWESLAYAARGVRAFLAARTRAP